MIQINTSGFYYIAAVENDELRVLELPGVLEFDCDIPQTNLTNRLTRVPKFAAGQVNLMK
jgi:hypothetical protein